MESPGTQISTQDYDYICRLVYEHSRIKLGPDKRELVTSRLVKRLRALKLSNYADYCRVLRSSSGESELPALIDRISTNHTQFFREMKHFEFLSETALPKWRARDPNGSRSLRVWSAASSSGEEPYSLAIYLAEHLAPASLGRWEIDATDISTHILEAARAGIYDERRVTGMPREWLKRHFQRGVGSWEGQYRIKSSLRERVRFQHLNLLQADYPFSQPFEWIFCRNVMIYFDRPTQEVLIRQLTQRLAPGGYLMVGHSESLSGVEHALRGVKPAIYQKPE